MWWQVLALVALGLIVYKFYWKPMLRAPVRETLPNTARLYFFYTDWCGFSKKAQPEWDSLDLPATFGSTKVEGVKVDCEKEKAQCSTYGIEGYPTVKLETSGGIQDYKGKMTKEALLEFLRSSLGKEPASG